MNLSVTQCSVSHERMGLLRHINVYDIPNGLKSIPGRLMAGRSILYRLDELTFQHAQHGAQVVPASQYLTVWSDDRIHPLFHA